MWCIGLAPDAWNLSGRCQATQDAQDAGDAEDATQDAHDGGDATQDAQDAKAPYQTQGNFLLILRY